MYESEREQTAKAKRLIELDGLIREAEALVSLYSTDPVRVATERRKRGRLILEREYYKRGHAFNTWPSMLAQMEEIERKSEAEAAERAKSEATRAAEAAAAEAENRAKIEAKVAAENDPVTLWRQARAARTF